MQYLAIADADRVQDYVFFPPQLRYVRGASRLQTNAIQKIRSAAGTQAILYANGGVVLARFDIKPDAERFCRLAQTTFQQETSTATVSTAIAEYHPADFPAGWSRVRDAVERAKRHRNGVKASSSHWLWVACQRCGSQPAENLVNEPENPNIAICQTCAHKFKAGAEHQAAISGLEPPNDFEELAKLSLPEGYLALLYIDLDKLGRYLEDNVKSTEDCSKIAAAIDETLRHAVREAGRRAAATAGPHQPSEGNRRKQPWLELLVGGDDCVLMLAAHLVPKFLEFFTSEFQFGSGLPKRPFFSAGIVFAHHQLPIGDFAAAAKGLCRKAKLRQEDDSVAFQVVTSSLVDNPDDLKKPTANPYSLPEFLSLIAGIASLKKINAPRSKIHRLYEIAWKSRSNTLQGQLEYLNLLIGLPDAPRAVLLESIGWDLWQKREDQELRTSAADLVELWEFINV
jgi:hypothetical protein